MLLETRREALPNGKQVRVARLGSGPPLILLHGYPDNLQIFSELAPRLASRFEVIAVDWPNMGESDPWPGGATPGHMSDRLLALLDAWKIDRASVLGADMGGQPALVFAAKHPGQCERVMVMNSLVLWDEATSWEIALLRKFGANRLVLGRLPGIVFRRCERSFLPRGIRLPAELRADLWDAFRRPEVRAFIIRMCAGYEATLHRLPEHYQAITVPALVLWGALDTHFPPAHARRLHQLVPSSTLDILPDAGHWMAWSHAPAVADAILRFSR